MAMAPINNATNLSKQLSQLIQAQINNLGKNPKAPAAPDYSNLDNSVIDPQKAAAAAAAAQYDPQIAALNRQINQAGPQNKLDQSNIKDWFKQALNTYNAGSKMANTQYDNSTHDLSGAASGFVSALGGSANNANPEIAAQALIQQGLLAGNHMADTNLDSNMQAMIPLSENQAHVNESGRFSQLMGDLNSQLSSAKSARGAFEQSQLQDANNTKFGQLSTIDNAKNSAAQQMFTDLMDRKNSNTSANSSIMNGIIAAMMAPSQLTAANLSNKLKGADINYRKAITNQLAHPGINLARPGDANQMDKIIRGAITRTVTNPSTGDQKAVLNSDPRKAWDNIMGVLKRYGIQNSAGIDFAKTILKGYLPNGWSIGSNGKLHGPNDWITQSGKSSESDVRGATYTPVPSTVATPRYGGGNTAGNNSLAPSHNRPTTQSQAQAVKNQFGPTKFAPKKQNVPSTSVSKPASKPSLVTPQKPSTIPSGQTVTSKTPMIIPTNRINVGKIPKTIPSKFKTKK